jgi:hypothetical protein
MIYIKNISVISYFLLHDVGSFKTFTGVGEENVANTARDTRLCTNVKKNTKRHPHLPSNEALKADTTSGPVNPATAPIVLPTVFRMEE